MEKPKKEPFDMEKCRQDLICSLKSDISDYLLGFVEVTLGFGGLAGCLTYAYALRPSIWLLLGIILLGAMPVVYFIGPLCYVIQKGIRIAGMNYYIVEDTLCGLATTTRSRGKFHLGQRPSSMREPSYRYEYYFDAYGKCDPECSFTWSKTFIGSLSRTSHAGDKFYLLIHETGRKKKKTIVCIYPQKYFVWQDENFDIQGDDNNEKN